MIKNILIFGPQGSGKGTQAEKISRLCGFIYISTGNIFRQEIEDKSDLGKLANFYIRDGKLAPDDVTNAMVKKRLEERDVRKKGFVLDGYPRSLSQAQALALVVRVTNAVLIYISDEEAISRISGRMACVCGMTYHTEYNPPKKPGICDRCGKRLVVRDDDRPEVVKKRLQVYHENTEPIINYYKNSGIFIKIDGEQPIPSVHKDVMNALGLKC